MPGRTSIVIKLVVVITLCSSLIFAGALGYNYYRSRIILEQELESNARNLALSLVHRVETELAAVTKVTQGVATSLEVGRYTEKELLSLARTTVEHNPEVYGVGVAFEPYAFDAATRLYAPYYYREEGKISFSRLESCYRNRPYLSWDWYRIPRESGRLEWSEPYYGEGGKALMATCSVPFHGGIGTSRRIRGIVAGDISLDSLTKLVSSIKILKSGYALLLSHKGMILAHPLKEAVMNETIFSIGDARHDPSLGELGKKMVRGESGFILNTSLVGVRSWMYYAPIRSTGWTLAVVFPEAELLENVNRLTMTMGAIGCIGILLLTVAVLFIARSITRPLRSLAAATHLLAAGNFDGVFPPLRSNDEVGALARDFQVMTESLKEYIRNLTESTAARERIQGELRVATDIQAGLLPRIFPPFPDRPEFDIFASMDPAKEVGGDFYDFFFVDEQNLCFLIADVADKGVPAALYMMVAKTLLKSEGQRLGEPDRILSSVNNILAADNDSCMFTTVFCAILNTGTGEVRFANAGHNPPLLMESRGIRYLTLKPGFVLGPIPDTPYETERIALQPGDTLLLYTDGVTESKNREDELYGEQQLLAALQRAPKDDLAAMIHFIRKEVTAHAAGAPQSDDITMVALTYRGATKREPGNNG